MRPSAVRSRVRGPPVRSSHGTPVAATASRVLWCIAWRWPLDSRVPSWTQAKSGAHTRYRAGSPDFASRSRFGVDVPQVALMPDRCDQRVGVIDDDAVVGQTREVGGEPLLAEGDATELVRGPAPILEVPPTLPVPPPVLGDPDGPQLCGECLGQGALSGRLGADEGHMAGEGGASRGYQPAVVLRQILPELGPRDRECRSRDVDHHVAGSHRLRPCRPVCLRCEGNIGLVREEVECSLRPRHGGLGQVVWCGHDGGVVGSCVP